MIYLLHESVASYTSVADKENRIYCFSTHVYQHALLSEDVPCLVNGRFELAIFMVCRCNNMAIGFSHLELL